MENLNGSNLKQLAESCGPSAILQQAFLRSDALHSTISAHSHHHNQGQNGRELTHHQKQQQQSEQHQHVPPNQQLRQSSGFTAGGHGQGENLQSKMITTFEDAFPNYSGPKKVFGVLKKKQKGGFGKIISKFTTKYVDLNLSTGVFQYVNKKGEKATQIQFREIEDIFVRCINEDSECPKDYPFSFSFRSKKHGTSKFRDYTFACKTKEERDQWLQSFHLLIEFRQLLQAQSQKQSHLMRILQQNQSMHSDHQVQQVMMHQKQIGQNPPQVDQNAMKRQQELQKMQEEIENKQRQIANEHARLQKKAEEFQKTLQDVERQTQERQQKAQAERAKKGLPEQEEEEEYDDETDSGSEDEGEKFMPVEKQPQVGDRATEERKSSEIASQIETQQERKTSFETQQRIQQQQIQQHPQQYAQEMTSNHNQQFQQNFQFVKSPIKAQLQIQTQPALSQQLMQTKTPTKVFAQFPTSTKGGQPIVLRKSQIQQPQTQKKQPNVEVIIDRENEQELSDQSDNEHHKVETQKKLNYTENKPFQQSIIDNEVSQREEIKKLIGYKAGVDQDFNDIIQKQRDVNFLEKLEQKRISMQNSVNGTNINSSMRQSALIDTTTLQSVKNLQVVNQVMKVESSLQQQASKETLLKDREVLSPADTNYSGSPVKPVIHHKTKESSSLFKLQPTEQPQQEIKKQTDYEWDDDEDEQTDSHYIKPQNMQQAIYHQQQPIKAPIVQQTKQSKDDSFEEEWD